MSDYIFMLESHLTTSQFQLVNAVQAAAAEANVSVFLAGGAMRDVLGGYPVRDLDFVIEGSPKPIVKVLQKSMRGEIVSTDDHKKSIEMLFPGNVTAEFAMAKVEKNGRAGSKPAVVPATIHEDLKGRDFTINAIALSLNKASRALLLDPTNGLADLERREIHTAYSQALYDDPSRILRMWRFSVRMNFPLSERTRSQYGNVKEAGLHLKISEEVLGPELMRMAAEQNPAELLRILNEEKILPLFSPALTGAKVNLAGMQKLMKARTNIPFEIGFTANDASLFLYLLTQKFSPKEKAQLIKKMGIGKAAVSGWQQLEAKAKKLEKEIKAPALKKLSLVYKTLKDAPGEQMVFLLMNSNERIVQDRIKNHLQKLVGMAQEVTDQEVFEATKIAPGAPKFAKAKDDFIAKKLDSRPRKLPEPEPEPVPPQGKGGKILARI